jgi:Flp pilus assembly protein TadG
METVPARTTGSDPRSSHPSPIRRRVQRRRRGGRSEAGVTLVEFSLILPIFLVLLLAMIEFGVAFNAVLSVNRASQNAVLLAGQAGNDLGSDCLILDRIERQLGAPVDKRDIVQVQIMRMNTTGAVVQASNVYTRSGSMTCDDTTVPYTASTTGYPESQRCNVQAGCPTLSPPRSTVDKVGVRIRYRHAWVTPLRFMMSFVGGDGSDRPNWVFERTNISRMEPKL